MCEANCHSSTDWVNQPRPLSPFQRLNGPCGNSYAASEFLTGRRRSSLLQIVGATGLTGSALLPYLIIGRAPGEQLLLLWGVFALHNTDSVLLVHARIEAIRSRGDETVDRPRRQLSRIWHLLEATAMAGLVLVQPLLSIALLASWAVHAFDLLRLDSPRQLAVPLQRVGFRELGLSAVFAALATAALW